jgi:CheY-like chemotaxis protein
MVHTLIIDDDPNNVEILQRLLQAQDAECIVILDPTRLKDSWGNLREADVVFLDLEMPHMNGYQVFEILQNELGPTVPIIAYTVHISEINRVRELGFHGFLGKPLDAVRFPDQLTRILRGEPVWEP